MTGAKIIFFGRKVVVVVVFVPLLPDQIALELATVGDHKQLCGPLSTSCVFQEDQASGSVAEISRKTHSLRGDEDETDRKKEAKRKMNNKLTVMRVRHQSKTRCAEKLQRVRALHFCVH